MELKRILMAIHKPKVDFHLIFTLRIYPKRLGTYYPHRRLIYVHGGRGGFSHWLETAIHEYAHHIHHTEVNENVGDNKSHGKTFNFIFESLMATAIQQQHFTRSDLFKKP